MKFEIPPAEVSNLVPFSASPNSSTSQSTFAGVSKSMPVFNLKLKIIFNHCSNKLLFLNYSCILTSKILITFFLNAAYAFKGRVYSNSYNT